VIDISNPASPIRVGGYAGGTFWGVSVVGIYAYVAGNSGLQVIDISNPASPIRVGGYDTSGYAQGVSVVGNYAYVAVYDGGLQVIDISNPASPIRVGGYDTSGYAQGVSVAGNYAYVADGNSGLQMIDISNPTSPMRVAGYDTCGYAYGVSLVGTYAYVADASNGLVVLGLGEMHAPSDLLLSNASVAENQPIGTAVGTLSSTDPDAGNTFAYSLVSGTGSTDNGSFSINGSAFQTAASFNYEAKSSYSIRLRTTDQSGLYFEKQFTITVTNVNETPTDIALSSSSMAENQPIGTAVSALSSTDPDAGNTFTYSLVSGSGGVDNASFTIGGNQLLATASFNFEAKNSYGIRLRTTDQGGLWFEETFTISVLNAAEVVPTINGISTDTGSSSSDGITSDPTLLINGTSEPGMTITVYRGGVLAGTTSANGSGNWIFDYTGISLSDGSYNFTATASDGLGNTTAESAPYAVTVDTAVPALPTSSINDGAAQRSMVKKLTLSFGEKVVLDTGAVTIKKSDGSDVPDTTLLLTNPSGDQKNYVLSFSGIGVVGGSLADGIYDLSVAAAGVHDLAGNALSGSFSQRFHRLYGDYDGNKTVNNGDYFWFKQTFNKSVGETGFLDLCDYDANGTVNNGDYFQFKKRFGVIYTY